MADERLGTLMPTPTDYMSGFNENFANFGNSALSAGKSLWAKRPRSLGAGAQMLGQGVESLGQSANKLDNQAQTASMFGSIMPHLQKAAPQLLHSLVPMGGVLRSGGLPAIAGMAGMVAGRNTMAPLFEGPKPQEFGAQAAATPTPTP
jgi:hypothetical protein